MPIHGYPGGVITANPVAPTASVATGVWTTEQQLQAVSQGNWPGYEYPISRSLRFNSADSAYLNRTPASAGNRDTWTWSAWVKRSALATNVLFFAGTLGSNDSAIYFGGNNNLDFFTRTSSSLQGYIQTPAVFRDVSAWYHIVAVYDSGNATSADRMILYVNGTRQTVTVNNTLPQNTDSFINSNVAHQIGSYGSDYLSGYLTEVNFIDGQALTASSFGETDSATGVWKPKAYTGTYGTNGFYLKFSDNSGTTSTTLGKDSSGNGNNWTPNNFSVTAGAGNDSLVDSPTSYGTDTGVGGEVRGNYCTLNPLDNAQGATFSNGNLQAANAAATDKLYRGTFGMSSGKWYWEVQLTTVGNRNGLGVTDIAQIYNATTLNGSYAVVQVGNQDNSTSGSLSGSIPAFSNNDYITFALDIAAGTLYFEKNAAPNISTSPKFTGLSTTTTYFVTSRESGGTPGTNIFNFGQRAFQYTATSGFKALCTQNLPTPTIGATSTTQANDYFNVVTRTFTAATAVITGLGFSPDWLWFKRRNTAASHSLYDRLRGTNARLLTNGTNAEITTTSAELTSFDSDGFTIGSDPGSISINSSNGDTGVVWCWKANGAGSTNTAGSITSTVSANTTSGFSIVTYTGTGTLGTVGHGLGVAPSMVIIKKRSSATISNWVVGATATGWTGQMYLDSTAAFSSNSGSFNNTAPTSSVFTINTDSTINASTQTYVAYCFAPVAGYSAFGSYTGNGSTDGPFVYTGFRPRYVMIKRTDSTSDWTVWDTARNTYNTMNLALYPNLSNAEVTTSIVIDTVSNGIKIRNSNADTNASGGTYIYAAFAESPFKYALAR